MFEYTFNEKCNLLIWRPSVQIDINIATEVAQSIAQIESERPPFNRFVDLTKVSGISLHVSEMEKIANLRQAYQGPKVKAAHYSPHSLGFGIGRLYQALMIDNNIEIEVFGNIGSCANWLGVSESVLTP